MKKKIIEFVSGKVIKLLGIVLVGLLLVFLIFTVTSQADTVFNLYTSVYSRPYDSKTNFQKKLITIVRLNNTYSEYSFTINNQGEIVRDDGTIVNEEGEPLPEQPSGGDDFSGESQSGAPWSGGSLGFSALEMYDKYSFSGTGSPITSITLKEGVQLYTGIPWADDGTWYKLNVDSVRNYLSTFLGKRLEFSSTVHSDRAMKQTAPTKSGVKCMGIAWAPILCFMNVSDNGAVDSAYDRGAPAAENSYGVAVLTKNGQTFYLPICSGGDNKGHTFPGGMVQTYVGDKTRLNNGVLTIDNMYTSDINNIKWNGTKMHGMNISMSDFVANWKTAVSYKNNTPVSNAGHPTLSLEVHPSMVSCLNGYTVEGFIMHKGA